jgi:sigma-B regulation protein RsbU (phosphoserine phosphatase)
MNKEMQKKLYKALDKIAASEFKNPRELFQTVLQALIKDAQYSVTGGRIWVLDKKAKAYRILYQSGKVKRIKKDFILKLSENEIFKKIAEERTIIADEINDELKKKGIFRYSASGFGKKIKIGNDYFYQYLLALSSDHISKEFKYLLNVVATLLTSKLNPRYPARYQCSRSP